MPGHVCVHPAQRPRGRKQKKDNPIRREGGSARRCNMSKSTIDRRGCREESAATRRLRTRSGCRAATDADHRSSETREETRDRKRAPQKSSPQRGVLGSTLEGWRRSPGTTPKKRAHSVEIKFCWQSSLKKTRPPTTEKTHTHPPCTAHHTKEVFALGHMARLLCVKWSGEWRRTTSVPTRYEV